MSSLAASQLVVILGAGPGVGFACGRLFAQRGHPVALLSRSQQRLEVLSKQINDDVGDASRTRPYACDVTKGEDVQRVFNSIVNDWKDKAQIHTAIFNPGGLFKMAPFLETTEKDVRGIVDTQLIGALHFAQEFIKAAQQTQAWKRWQDDPTHTSSVANLLFTGATASLRGGKNFSAFASSSFALRAMSQSIAREFMPQGIHVSHVVINGMINTDALKQMVGEKFEPNSRVEPDEIAQVYYDITQQKRSAWTFEMDLQPAKETW